MARLSGEGCGIARVPQRHVKKPEMPGADENAQRSAERMLGAASVSNGKQIPGEIPKNQHCNVIGIIIASQVRLTLVQEVDRLLGVSFAKLDLREDDPSVHFVHGSRGNLHLLQASARTRKVVQQTTHVGARRSRSKSGVRSPELAGVQEGHGGGKMIFGGCRAAAPTLSFSYPHMKICRTIWAARFLQQWYRPTRQRHEFRT
jgi:hypothetical protein